MGVWRPPHQALRAPEVHHLPRGGGRDSAVPESFCRAQEWGGGKQDKAKLQVRDSNIGQGDLTEGSAGRKGPAAMPVLSLPSPTLTPTCQDPLTSF